MRVCGGGTEYGSVANALQIAAGVWAAPAHVLRSPDAGQYEVVLPDGGTIALTPCHRSADHDFAVFRSGSDWPWTARPQWGPAEPGERISLVGWLVGSAVSAVQATVDLTAQESQVPGLIAMIGPAPPAGSSGSALVVVRTGRVVGILTGVGALDRRQQAPGAGDTGVVIGVLPAAVPERLRSGAGTPADPPPPPLVDPVLVQEAAVGAHHETHDRAIPEVPLVAVRRDQAPDEFLVPHKNRTGREGRGSSPGCAFRRRAATT